MKKIIFCLAVMVLSLTVLPLQSFGSTTEETSSKSVTKPPERTESAEAKALAGRIDEIKAMDMSNMKSAEKKDLRKEVRSMKREYKAVSGGVYISAGLLIVILIILIVLV
jgi:hypothetical protein